MDDRTRAHAQLALREQIADVRYEAAVGGHAPEFRTEFGPFIGDEPGAQMPGRIGAGPAVEGHPVAAVPQQQSGGREPW
ncbi:hypothetical protein OH805_35410 [Streptomyces sp. NBC_00879]|uniref:hypothetical protein n=1 Tax=unclassified Streptomyces TaxID=2593676 RepID=UPI003867B70D|nr:hypothetical protein OHA61_37235 [Streptomyces sp. NBC_00885]WSY79032.1 hypothetical protein OH805_35410 [Streptomyces sp. NBC_00879]